MRLALICAAVIAVAVAAVAFAIPAIAQDATVVIEGTDAAKTWLDYAREGLTALLTLFGVGVAGAVLTLIVKMFPGIGKALDDDRRKRIQELILNGMFWAVNLIKSRGQAPTPFDVKKLAVEYATEHGKKYLDALGVKPTAPSTREALSAQAERMINDPAVATPPEVTPPGGKPAAVVVAAPQKPA